MTSFTKALYNRDPKAADAFYRQSTFEHKLVYGRTPTLAQFTATAHELPTFGKRMQSEPRACAALCGHPACAKGCTLNGGYDR